MLKSTPGVVDAKASFTDGSVRVTYEAGAIGLGDVEKTIEALDYRIRKEARKFNILGFIVTIAALYVLYTFLNNFGLLNFFYDFPEANESMGYGMLFVVGLFASVHCIGMCGGINLSLSLSGSYSSSLMPRAPLQAMQLYALGTGSFVKGALSMLFFSTGTLPLMFGLSTLSSILSKKFTRAAITVGPRWSSLWESPCSAVE